VLYSAVQCCTVLYSAVQCCTVLDSAVQCCTVLYSTVEYSPGEPRGVQRRVSQMLHTPATPHSTPQMTHWPQAVEYSTVLGAVLCCYWTVQPRGGQGRPGEARGGQGRPGEARGGQR